MKLKLTIPQTWNACTDAQLKKLALLINSDTKGNHFDLKCFAILINAKWWQLYKKALHRCILSWEPITVTKESFAFIYQSNTLTRFPKIKAINKKQYFPPLPQISNLSIGEMAIADDLHIKWRATHDVECLYYLAATLYVNQQQPRPPFDKNDLSFKEPLFRKLSLDELLVIEMAFHGCKEHLAKKFPKVFPTKKQSEADVTLSAVEGQKPQIAKSSQFPKLILELSGGKFGTHEQTSRTNCYTFLAEFENLLKAQK
jgi:hypothetical protein